MTLPLACAVPLSPQVGLADSIRLASEAGLSHVVLWIDPTQSGLLGDHVLKHDPGDVARWVTDAGLRPAALATTLTVCTSGKCPANVSSEKLHTCLDIAGRLGAPCVRVEALNQHLKLSWAHLVQRVAEQAQPLVTTAARNAARIALANNAYLAPARFWWAVLNQVQHPMVRLTWNATVAAGAGEMPSVSIPMLNTRIRLVEATNLKLADDQPLPAWTVDLLRRLMGIGYDRPVAIGPGRPDLAGPIDADQALTQLTQLRARFEQAIEQLSSAEPAKA